MVLVQPQLLKARVASFKSTLENASDRLKEGRVSTPLALEFNKIRNEVAQAFPDVEAALPAAISSSPPHRRLGQSDVNYLDLEIYAEQLLSIIALLDSTT